MAEVSAPRVASVSRMTNIEPSSSANKRIIDSGISSPTLHIDVNKALPATTHTTGFDSEEASATLGVSSLRKSSIVFTGSYKRGSDASIATPRSPRLAPDQSPAPTSSARSNDINEVEQEFFFPQNKQSTSSLEKIIEDPVTREQFRTFLSTRSAEENLAFLMALKRLSSNSVRQTYYWYICEDSPYEINITSACASELISTYRRINGTATASEWFKIFSKAKLEVINLLQCVVPEFTSWVKKQYTLWTELKPNQKRVLIIGGGPCGVMAASLLQGMDAFQVSIISKTDYIEFKPALVHVNEPLDYDKYNIGLADILPNANVVLGEVTSVNKNEAYIGEFRVEFDYLVIATGKSYKLGPTWAPATGITREYNRKAVTLQANAIKGSNSILVIGGTPFGVSVAAEILCKYPDKRVILLEQSEHLFSTENYGMVGAGDVAKRYLERLGCEVHCNVLVTATISDPDRGNIYNVHAADGTVFAVELVISAQPGTVATSIVTDPTMLDDKGYVKVEKTLQVEGCPRIFAGGVCSRQLDNVNNTFVNSMIAGCIIARNICRDYKGKELSFAGHKGFPDFVLNATDALAAIYVGNKAFGRFGLVPLGKRSPDYLGSDLVEDLVLSQKYSEMHIAGYNFWLACMKGSCPIWLADPPKRLSCNDYEKNRK